MSFFKEMGTLLRPEPSRETDNTAVSELKFPPLQELPEQLKERISHIALPYDKALESFGVKPKEAKEIIETTQDKLDCQNDTPEGMKAADTVFQETNTRTPETHGVWDGKRGDSVFHPDSEYIPPEKSRNPETSPYSNPDGLSWGQILKKFGLSGIEFRNGFPVFENISRGTIEISGFETGGVDAKDRNFKRADIAMAAERGCTPQEVSKWRKENNYTWHECEDMRTMQKVPHEIHANIPHDGGRSQ